MKRGSHIRIINIVTHEHIDGFGLTISLPSVYIPFGIPREQNQDFVWTAVWTRPITVAAAAAVYNGK